MAPYRLGVCGKGSSFYKSRAVKDKAKSQNLLYIAVFEGKESCQSTDETLSGGGGYSDKNKSVKLQMKNFIFVTELILNSGR